MRRITIITLILIFVLSFSCTFSRAQTSTVKNDSLNQISMEDKLLGLSLLWKEAAYNFAYFERLPDLDWNKKYAEYLTKVLETKDDLTYYMLLQEFMTLLKEGHTRVIIPQHLMPHFYKKMKNRWFIFDWVGDDLYVTASRMAVAEHLPPGSKIIEINSIPSWEYFKTTLSTIIHTPFEHTFKSKTTYMIMYDFKNSMNTIKYIIPSGETRLLNLDTIKSSNNSWTEFTELDMRRDLRRPYSFTEIEDGIVYFDLAGDMDNELLTFFDSIYPVIKKAKGLIMDLRYNQGGSSVGNYIAMHFSKSDTIYHYIDTRVNNANKRAFGAYADSVNVAFVGGNIRHTQFYDYYNDTKFERDTFLIKNVVPLEKRITIPIVLLIDNYVGSATEDLLITMKSLQIGTIVGEPTAGSCTQPLVLMLPDGGVGMIATQRTMLTEDEVFTFIKPDVPVMRTIDDMLQGRDVIYEKGIEILKEKIKK